MDTIRVRVNGKPYAVDVEPYDSLNFVLRERLGLIGTKNGCDTGGCGACTVLLNGNAIYSCMTYAPKVDGAEILTVEGLARGGSTSEIQKSFVKHYALQCGYCTPGFLIATKSLLDKNPNPTEEEIREALVGNICRCTGYTKIVEAVIDLRKKE